MNSSVKLGLGIVAALALFALANSFFIVQMTQHAIVLRFGQVVRQPISEPGLYFKVPFIENVVTVDKRILDLDLPVQTVLSTDRQNLDVDAFARYRITQPLRFFQTVRTVPNANTRLASFVNSSMRNIIAGATMSQLIRTERDRLMNRIQEEVNREAGTLGVEIVDLRLTRVDLPQVNQEAVFNRMQTERRQEAADLRATGNQAAVTIRARADREVVGILAEANRRAKRCAVAATPSATRSSPRPTTAIRTSSRSIAACRPTSRASNRVTPASSSRRTRSSSATSAMPPAIGRVPNRRPKRRATDRKTAARPS